MYARKNELGMLKQSKKAIDDEDSIVETFFKAATYLHNPCLVEIRAIVRSRKSKPHYDSGTKLRDNY